MSNAHRYGLYRTELKMIFTDTTIKKHFKRDDYDVICNSGALYLLKNIASKSFYEDIPYRFSKKCGEEIKEYFRVRQVELLMEHLEKDLPNEKQKNRKRKI